MLRRKKIKHKDKGQINELISAQESTPVNYQGHLGQIASDAAIVDRLLELAAEKAKPYSSEEGVAMLDTLKQAMPDITASSCILYPGSAADTKCADVFGVNVIHVDPDGESMHALEAIGLQTITSTFEDYLATLPDNFLIDVILSHNSGLLPEAGLQRLREGGYVIANNWHGSANALGENPDFEILYAISPGANTLINAQTAKDGLGTTRIAITNQGRLIRDPVEINNLPENTYSVIETENNPDTQWLFRKKAL